MQLNYKEIVIILFIGTFFNFVFSHDDLCVPNCIVSVLDRSNDVLRAAGCVTQANTSLLHNTSELYAEAYQPELDNNKLWYLYHDRVEDGTKVALNISWRPPASKLQYIFGYRITMKNLKSKQTLYRYFNITNVFSADDELLTPYNLNCFDQVEVLQIHPGDRIMIEIISESIFGTQGRLMRSFTIPSCDDPNMNTVKKCHRQKPSIKVAEGCGNGLKTLSWFLPSGEGDSASILFCELQPRISFCTTTQIFYENNLHMNGSYTISLPHGYNSNRNYSVQVWGTKSEVRYSKLISFSDCPQIKPKDGPTTPNENQSNVSLTLDNWLLVALVASALLVILIILLYGLILQIIRRWKMKKIPNNNSQMNLNETNEIKLLFYRLCKRSDFTVNTKEEDKPTLHRDGRGSPAQVLIF